MHHFKKCKICDKEFKPFKTTQKVCSTNCAIIYSKEKRKKKELREWNKKKKILKEKLETISSLANKTQKVFNRYIRLRDEGKPCISCKTSYKDNFQAGHYFSSGGNWSTRFNENNCFNQCIRCNMYLSGNLREYSINILDRISEQDLEDLEKESKKTIKYTKEQLLEIKQFYLKKIENLKKDKKN